MSSHLQVFVVTNVENEPLKIRGRQERAHGHSHAKSRVDVPRQSLRPCVRKSHNDAKRMRGTMWGPLDNSKNCGL